MTDQRTRLGQELVAAILDYQEDKVVQLLRQDLNINAADGKGSTPLHAACWRLSPIDHLYKEILSRQPEMNAKDIHGQTPLMYSVTSCQSHFERHLALLENGAGLYEKNDIGETVMDLIRKKADTQEVEQFFQQWIENDALLMTVYENNKKEIGIIKF